MIQRTILALFISFTLIAAAHAQPPIWETNFGAQLTQLTGQEKAIQKVRLKFDFPCFGVGYRFIYIHVDGGISLGEAVDLPNVVDWPVGFINASAPIIAPFFSYLNLTQAGTMFFNDDFSSERAVITWSSVGSFLNPQAGYTFQLQLMADGRIIFGYNGIASTLDTLGDSLLVGVSGGGDVLARRINYTNQPSLTLRGSIYEIFDEGEKPFDIDEANLIFRPSPSTGIVSPTFASPGVGPRADFSTDPLHADSAPVTVTFTDTSIPGDRPISSWAWDFESDGVIDSIEQNPTHTYSPLASYSVTLKVSDGVESDVEVKADFIEVNPTPPVADAGGPYTALEGVGLTLHAFGSPDLTYEWDLDGNGEFIEGIAPTVSFADNTPAGTPLTISLRVTDAQGLTDTATATVEVNNVPPTISLGGVVTIPEGTEYTLTLGEVTDPGDDTVTEYIVDWGDGVPQTFDASASREVTHIYVDGETTPTITVSLTDEDGTHVAAGQKSITVSNVAPTILLTGVDTFDEGSQYTLTLGTVTDPGTDTVAKYIVDWGDGVPQTFDASASREVTHIYVDGETTPTITVSLTDEDGTHVAAGQKSITTSNVVPTIVLSGEATVEEGSPYILTLGKITDPGDDTVFVNIVHWGDGTLQAFTTNGDVTHIYADSDNTSGITVDLVDEDGYHHTAGQKTITVSDIEPTIELLGADMVAEGEEYTLTLGEVTDPGDDTVSVYTVIWGDGIQNTYNENGDVTHTYADGPTMPMITVDLTDEDGTHLLGGQKTIDVSNVSPTISTMSAPTTPIPVGTEITVIAEFTDPGVLDTHTATFDWGDLTPSDGAVVDGAITGTHTYTNPGVYRLTLTVTDDDGGEATSIFEFVVVYDPDGEFVTGGGGIDSPEGAYPADPLVIGQVNFDINAKYKNNATVPTGQTEFNFSEANLNFHSQAYNWLVVTDYKAQYKGSGTINGEGNYGFMLTVIDEKLTPTTDVDLFRMKIWDIDDNDAIVYDNQMNAPDDADPTTPISGNIKIHQSNENGPPAAPARTLLLTVYPIPEKTELLRNYPNPLNPETWIPYQLAEEAFVTLTIYNMMGRVVRTINVGHRPAGMYLSRDKTIYWDGRNDTGEPVSSNVYFYVLSAGNYTATRKMVILK